MNEQDLVDLIDNVKDDQAEWLANGEFRPALMVYKNGVLRMACHPPMEDHRAELFLAMNIFGTTSDADTMIFVSDSYGVMGDPETTKTDWEPGEIGKAFNDPNHPHHDLVYECLCMYVCNREGVAMMASTRYDRDGDKVNMQEPIIIDEMTSGYMDGRLVSAMREAMTRDSAVVGVEAVFGVSPETLGIEPWRAVMFGMCAGAKYLGANIGVQVAVGCMSEQERDAVEHSFGPQGMSFYRPEDLG